MRLFRKQEIITIAGYENGTNKRRNFTFNTLKVASIGWEYGANFNGVSYSVFNIVMKNGQVTLGLSLKDEQAEYLRKFFKPTIFEHISNFFHFLRYEIKNVLGLNIRHRFS
ncbi:MAG: hypothetical protein LBT79_04475 [Elusimicrobiota bacterium]|jgi:hypothetical protein|nr:hypothetical protein [Elusimicrobiota bacterium]